MTTLNRSLWRGSHRSAISRWPVEEMGINSVIPSMIPKIMTAIQSGIGWLDGKSRRLTSAKLAFHYPDRCARPDTERVSTLSLERGLSQAATASQGQRVAPWSQPHCGGCSLVAPRQNRKSTQQTWSYLWNGVLSEAPLVIQGIELFF